MRNGVRRAILGEMCWLLLMVLTGMLFAEDVFLRNVNEVDPEAGSVRMVSLRISGERTQRLKANAKAPAGVRVVDGSGKYVIPGLWDGHFHAVRPETEKQSRRMMGELVAHGITQIRDMGSVPEAVVALKKEIAAGSVVGPEMFVAGMMIDGPPSKAGATMAVVKTAEEARAMVDRMAGLGVDFIKVQQNVSAEVYQAIVARAKEKGLAVHGHTPDAVTPLDLARMGQRTLEHLTGVLVSCAGQEVEIREAIRKGQGGVDFGPLGAAGKAMMDSYDGAKAAELARALRDVVQVPTLAWEKAFVYHPGAMKRRRPETDALMKAQYGKALEVIGLMQRNGVTMVAGTDGGDEFTTPGASLHEELELLVAAGLTPLDALRAGTRNGWKMMGRTSRGGNFVVLSANPLTDIRNTRQVEAVVLRGRLLDGTILERLKKGEAER